MESQQKKKSTLCNNIDNVMNTVKNIGLNIVNLIQDNPYHVIGILIVLYFIYKPENIDLNIDNNVNEFDCDINDIINKPLSGGENTSSLSDITSTYSSAQLGGDLYSDTSNLDSTSSMM